MDTGIIKSYNRFHLSQNYAFPALQNAQTKRLDQIQTQVLGT